MISQASFYDELAEDYHLIFEDWDRSIQRQASVLGPLLKRYVNKPSACILDCACGIGTQAIGLSQLGFRLVASDVSEAAIKRARKEAEKRHLDLLFRIADMRSLSAIPEGDFDAVLAADNALPHLLTRADLDLALNQMAAKLTDSGIALASLRDYDSLISSRPAIQPPAFFGAPGSRRIVHQVWQWDGDLYDVHLYITCETASGWIAKHYVAAYRALLRAEVNDSFHRAGFSQVEWLEPGATGFYQPIVVARKG